MSTREVELTGGAPWGFRMHGGADQNQPLRISRVNPGRKASLSGIREGDIISSINGRPTRSMSNSEAHALLRSSGPVLKLGLNEDRDMSPRRRSVGKATELKRPSQLIAEVQSNRAVPQAPVYATIRPSQSPNNTYTSLRSSLNSLPGAVTSSNLLKTMTTEPSEEQPKFHPTNPFYSTLPTNNYSSASKLPVPNGRSSLSSLDRSRSISKSRDSSIFNDSAYAESLKSPVNNYCDSGPSTFVDSHINNHPNSDNYEFSKANVSNFIKNDPLLPNANKGNNDYSPSNDTYFKIFRDSTSPNTINSHEFSTNIKDPYEKYLRMPEGKGTHGDTTFAANSNGHNDIYNCKEEIIKNTTITEHKIDEIEEIKTIKKITFNGSDSNFQHSMQPSSDKESQNKTGKPTAAAATPTLDERLKSPGAASASAEPLSPRTPQQEPVTTKPIWRPGAPSSPSQGTASGAVGAPRAPPPPPPPPPPVWSPCSAGASPRSPRRTFRPVHFEETPPPTRKLLSTVSGHNGCGSESESESRGLRTSLSAPASGLRALGEAAPASAPPAARLPRAQNPTVTLLQKAREGQTSKSSNYSLESDSARLPRDRATPPKGDPVHALRREYASESEAEKREDESAAVRKMADTQKKVDVGPTTRDGMPVSLRSEVRDPSRWYKKMYDTIHKTKLDDDCVTIRYKSRRGQPIQRVSPNKSQYAYFDPRSGYLSEPEGGLSRLGSSTWSDAYDSDVTAGPRRRTASVQEERHHDDVTSPYLPSNKYSTLASARASQEVYKNQPGRIEDYVPGRSSVVDKEAKQWWDEVMDIFDGQLSSTTSLPQASPKEKKDLTSTILSKSNMARALKESGYESDSTLVFRRRDETEPPLSPAERRAAYRDLQAGGEPPLRGFRSPAPPRHEGGRTPDPPRRATHTSSSDTESPRRYLESDVNIHYRCPVRRDPLPLVPERELERQQADHMRRLYREQRRAKYMQDINPLDIEAFDQSIKELQDMQNRRHQDNFTPSQKAIVPLNRYDEAGRVLARALYTFSGQTPRELSFTKGEIINVQRQIDANWYEGELRGRTGLFPYNYVEILKGETTQTQKRPAAIEGRARAKFDFTAQTGLELPLKKGEIVVLTRRIDHNWWEGRHGSKTGIFPDSYVTVLQEPTLNKPELQSVLTTDKPVASPASHGLLNGSAKRSMGAHSYTPQLNSPALSNAPPATQPLPGYVAKPAHATLTTPERGYGPPPRAADLNNTEPLYVDTNAEAVPYRAMYKYRPQNPDELELREGDTVYVLEKCDDGWYVGSSQRTGRLGTFPGNYVERI